MSPSLVVWGHLPNRHNAPFLEAASRAGILAGVMYDVDSPSPTQLGTAASARHSFECVVGDRDMRSTVADVVDGHSGSHLVLGFHGVACREAIRQCSTKGRKFYMFGERLLPRSIASPRRMARDAYYRRLVRHAAGAFALGPAAATDFMKLGIAPRSIFPALYSGPSWSARTDRPLVDGVMYCGRLVANKRVALLVDACRTLWRRGHRFELHVVGSGPEEGNLRAALNGASATFYGAISTERVRAVMARASVLVLPTRYWEGWGYVVNESLSLGVPVVVTETVAARELIVEGRNGFVVSPERAIELAHALERALALRGAEQLKTDMATTRSGLDSDAFAHYLGLVIAGERPTPPWHVAVLRMGGNPDVLWWQRWLAGNVCDSRLPRSSGSLVK